MRKLGLTDVFHLSAIIDKLKIVDNIAEIQEKSYSQDDPQKYAGVQIMAILFTKMHVVKDEIVSWLSDLTSMTEEEVNKLSFVEIKKYISTIIESEEIKELFTSLSSKDLN